MFSGKYKAYVEVVVVVVQKPTMPGGFKGRNSRGTWQVISPDRGLSKHFTTGEGGEETGAVAGPDSLRQTP
ncbi:MAG: hypothetical protein ABSA46_05115 [Thermodesulfovibrionales bacterium]|jgi:hypothetical protein